MKGNLKVINLGLPKSGTTTLARALGRAGLRVADWKLTDAEGKFAGFVGAQIYMGYYASGDPLMRLRDYDAFTQIDVLNDKRNMWPQTDFGVITAIRELYPEAKFLLSGRDPLEQAQSMRRWTNLGTQRLPRMPVPGLPAGFGKSEAELAFWIEGHMKFCRQIFAGASDFLEYDIADSTARERISGFLGIDLPWWGVANANPNKEAPPDPLADDDETRDEAAD